MGTGKNTQFLAQIGQIIQALDFTPAMMTKARQKVKANHVKFTQADLRQPWPCQSQRYDLIVSNLVLEHINDLAFIFAEAARTLTPQGQFFICELHPHLQYEGKKAIFQRGDTTTEIPAFVHHITDFTEAGKSQGFHLLDIKEWWHPQVDQDQPPRLVSFLFGK